MNPPPLPPSDPSGPPGLPPTHQAPPAWQDPLLASAPKKRGTRPVFWVLLGVILLVVISLFVAGAAGAYSKIMKGVREKQAQRQAMEELQQLNAEQHKTLQADLDASGSISMEAGMKHMEKLQQILEKSSAGDSEEARASRAAAAWAQSVADAVKQNSAAAEAMLNARMTDVSNIKSKDDLPALRSLVQEFKDSNQHLSALFKEAEKDFTAQLRFQGMTPDQISKHTKAFIGGMRRKLPLIQKIREQDDLYAGVMVEWLDLVEKEWMEWTITDENLTFKNPKAEEASVRLLNEMKKVGEVQAEAQQQLMKIR